MSPSIRLLYAEDNSQDADMMRSHFASQAPGFDIETVDNGQGCLERLKEEEFDLLLLDYRLPDMDGLDVLKAMVHSGILVPVVMVTGLGDEELVVKALRLGAANYVPKQSNYLESLPILLQDVLTEHRKKLRIGLLPPLPPYRILYIEHVPMDIELTLRYFSEAAPHYVVELARTCAEALKLLEMSATFDLVLIDLQMPDQSGLDFVQEVRLRRLPLPPFIIISGRGNEAAAIAALKLGAADYATKHEGYLNQLIYCIDKAIAHDRVTLLNEKLMVELAERKQAEEELQQIKTHLEAMLNALPDILFEIDRDGRFHDYRTPNPELLYIQPEYFIGKTVKEVLPADASQVINRAIEEVVATGEHKEAIYSLPTQDGTGWFELSIAAKGDPLSPNARFIVLVHDITARKRAEEELEESREKYRGLSEAAFEAIFISEKGICLEQNLAAEKMFGYTSEEAIGRYGTEWIVPEDREMVMKHMLEGYELPYEATALKKDGNSFPCILSGKMMYFKGKAVRVTSLTDITCRKQAEEALRESEERMRDITFSMADWIWEIDEKGVYTYSSERGHEYFGSSLNDILGKTPFDFMPPEEAVKVGRVFSDIVAAKAPIRDLENWNITRSGDKICLLTNGVPILDKAGNLKGYRGVDKDITEWKKAQHALEISEEKFRQITENIREVFWLSSLDMMTFYYISPVYYQVWGNDAGDLYNNPTAWIDYIVEEDKEKVRAYLPMTFTKKIKEIQIPDFRIRRSDGSLAWISLRAFPVCDSTGKPFRVAGIAENITERKLAEEALHASQQIVTDIINTIPVRVFWKDMNLVFLGCNAVFAGDAGFSSPSDIIGKDDYQMGWHDQAELYRSDDREVIESGCSKLFIEEPQTTPDGNTINILTSKIPLRNSTGQVIGILGTYFDITERKRAEEALRESELRLKEAQRIAIIGNWELNLDTNKLFWSEEIFRIFEIDPAGFGASYETFLNAIHPDDRETVNNAYTSSLKTRNPYEIVHRLLMRDGRIKYVHERCETIYNKDGKPVCSVGTVQDITERKKIEIALKNQSVELEQFNKLMVGREIKMIELKKEINDLLEALGKEGKYKIHS